MADWTDRFLDNNSAAIDAALQGALGGLVGVIFGNNPNANPTAQQTQQGGYAQSSQAYIQERPDAQTGISKNSFFDNLLSNSNTGWIVGGILIVSALVLALILRRR